jgi:hypothetical protein
MAQRPSLPTPRRRMATTASVSRSGAVWRSWRGAHPETARRAARQPAKAAPEASSLLDASVTLDRGRSRGSRSQWFASRRNGVRATTVIPWPARNSPGGSFRCKELKLSGEAFVSPLASKSIGDLAVDGAGAQRPLGAVVGGFEVWVGHEDDVSGGAILPTCDI